VPAATRANAREPRPGKGRRHRTPHAQKAAASTRRVTSGVRADGGRFAARRARHSLIVIPSGMSVCS
jgi:hypothetical protein